MPSGNGSVSEVLTSGVILKNAGRFVFQVGFNSSRDALGVVRLGGHLEPGESPADAAVREAFEEATTRVVLVPSAATFRHEAGAEAQELVPTVWTGDAPMPLLVAEITSSSGVAGLSLTYLAESFDSPRTGAETQGLMFLMPNEVQWVATSPVTLGAFIDAGGAVDDPSGLPRDLPLRPHGQVRSLSILLERSLL